MMNLGIRHMDAITYGDQSGNEYQYLHLLQRCVGKALHSEVRPDRTGTGTFGIFGAQMRFDLSLGFPLLTTKRLFTRGIIAELLWMLAGKTNIQPLLDQNVHIWDEWADTDGELGPVYGAQWRDWCGKSDRDEPIDQIGDLLHNLRTKPHDRGHVVTAWNPAELNDMALRPCHCLFQVNIEDGKLNLQLYQRSADIFLGVPFNIASYALLTILLARELGLEPGDFIHTFGDLHLYSNHVEQAREQLRRLPRAWPRVEIDNDIGLFDLKTDNIRVVEYDPHPAIKGDVSI